MPTPIDCRRSGRIWMATQSGELQKKLERVLKAISRSKELKNEGRSKRAEKSSKLHGELTLLMNKSAILACLRICFFFSWHLSAVWNSNFEMSTLEMQTLEMQTLNIQRNQSRRSVRIKLPRKLMFINVFRVRIQKTPIIVDLHPILATPKRSNKLPDNHKFGKHPNGENSGVRR